MITCNGGYCSYRYLNSGSLGYGCNYGEYCDYQMPRDSRTEQSRLDSVEHNWKLKSSTS